MSPCGRCVLCIEGGERTQGREQLWGLRLEIKHLRVFGSQRKLERCTIPGFKNLCFTFLTFRARPGARGAVMTAQTISDALDVQDLQPRQKQVHLSVRQMQRKISSDQADPPSSKISDRHVWLRATDTADCTCPSCSRVCKTEASSQRLGPVTARRYEVVLCCFNLTLGFFLPVEPSVILPA